MHPNGAEANLSMNGNPHGAPQRGRSTKPRVSDRRDRHPGWNGIPDGALKGQKRYDGQCGLGLLPLQGARPCGQFTQGVAHLRSLALGLELGGLSGRLPFGVLAKMFASWVFTQMFAVRLKLSQSARLRPEWGNSTKPRASDRRERHPGW